MSASTNNADQMMPSERDYSSISPSARSILLMKGLTDIPFARQAAERMVYPEKYQPGLEGKETAFLRRLAHLEDRYWSIDQLLADLPVRNILELSSGFSFRGLEAVIREDVHYIDTDLPGVIATKKDFVEALQKDQVAPKGDQAVPKGDQAAPKGVLELLPLNALDAEAFGQTVSHFPAGPLAIVNEGLLMYLNEEEKLQLFRIIHRVLKERGGFWITADIYIKRPPEFVEFQLNDRLNQFFEQHRVRENMFDSFEAAKALFEKAGFVVEKEAVPDPSKINFLPNLLKMLSQEQLMKIANMPTFRVTWRLSAV
jgi:O-methyltransferase involved in polyketide biosynthesis